MKRVVTLSVVVICACAMNAFAQTGSISPSAITEQIHYILQFKMISGGAIPFGSFDYDSSKPTDSRYQNFLVNWNDARFDFTGVANALAWCDGKDWPSSLTPGRWYFQCGPIAGSMQCLPSLSCTPSKGEERSIPGKTVATPTIGGADNGTWYVQ